VTIEDDTSLMVILPDNPGEFKLVVGCLFWN